MWFSENMSRGKVMKSLVVCAVSAVVVLAILVFLPIVLVRVTQCRSVHYAPNKQFNAAQKLNPAFWLGNDEDPLPPPNYLPDNPDRVSSWYWRNPLHNFTFYVVGVADQSFERIGLSPEVVFSPEGGWNWCVVKCGWMELPFISYKQGKFQAYYGWRDRGNFGVKLNF